MVHAARLRALVASIAVVSTCLPPPSPVREAEAQAGTPGAVESAWIVARAITASRAGGLADGRTTYGLVAVQAFTARPIGQSAIPMPRAGERFELELRGGEYPGGYRLIDAEAAPLLPGLTYLVRLCESARAPVFTECAVPFRALRLVEDDPQARHPYFIAGETRAVVGWTLEGPAVGPSLLDPEMIARVADCLGALPPELLERLESAEITADPGALTAGLPPGDRCDLGFDLPFHRQPIVAPAALYAQMIAAGDAVGPELSARGARR